jgi:hypothetical protein
MYYAKYELLDIREPQGDRSAENQGIYGVEEELPILRWRPGVSYDQFAGPSFAYPT